MLKRKALMESISSNLHNFLKKIGKNLSVPDKKFLRDSLIGLIRCGKPIVCQMARHLPILPSLLQRRWIIWLRFAMAVPAN
jgi:hypothetical protein